MENVKIEKIANETFWVIFKHCEAVAFLDFCPKPQKSNQTGKLCWKPKHFSKIFRIFS